MGPLPAAEAPLRLEQHLHLLGGRRLPRPGPPDLGEARNTGEQRLRGGEGRGARGEGTDRGGASSYRRKSAPEEGIAPLASLAPLAPSRPRAHSPGRWGRHWLAFLSQAFDPLVYPEMDRLEEISAAENSLMAVRTHPLHTRPRPPPSPQQPRPASIPVSPMSSISPLSPGCRR